MADQLQYCHYVGGEIKGLMMNMYSTGIVLKLDMKNLCKALDFTIQ